MRWLWALGAVLIAGAVIYLAARPDPRELACDALIDAGGQAIAAGNLVKARGEAVKANLVCTGNDRSRAETLQAAIAKAEAANNACRKSLSKLERHLDNNRLRSARDGLDQLTGDCAAGADALALAQKLNKAQGGVLDAEASMRNALDAQDIERAKLAFARLSGADREHPDLARIKQELDTLIAAAATAEAAAQAASAAEAAAAAAAEAAEVPQVAERPVAAPAPRPADEAPPPRAPEQSRAPGRGNGGAGLESSQAVMAQAFLREAEHAFAQGDLPRAWANLNSARRLDPRNVRINVLARQLHQRERELLELETKIR